MGAEMPMSSKARERDACKRSRSLYGRIIWIVQEHTRFTRVNLPDEQESCQAVSEGNTEEAKTTLQGSFDFFYHTQAIFDFQQED